MNSYSNLSRRRYLSLTTGVAAGSFAGGIGSVSRSLGPDTSKERWLEIESWRLVVAIVHTSMTDRVSPVVRSTVKINSDTGGVLELSRPGPDGQGGRDGHKSTWTANDSLVSSYREIRESKWESGDIPFEETTETTGQGVDESVASLHIDTNRDIYVLRVSGGRIPVETEIVHQLPTTEWLEEQCSGDSALESLEGLGACLLLGERLREEPPEDTTVRLKSGGSDRPLPAEIQTLSGSELSSSNDTVFRWTLVPSDSEEDDVPPLVPLTVPRLVFPPPPFRIVAASNTSALDANAMVGVLGLEQAFHLADELTIQPKLATVSIRSTVRERMSDVFRQFTDGEVTEAIRLYEQLLDDLRTADASRQTVRELLGLEDLGQLLARPGAAATVARDLFEEIATTELRDATAPEALAIESEATLLGDSTFADLPMLVAANTLQDAFFATEAALKPCPGLAEIREYNEAFARWVLVDEVPQETWEDMKVFNDAMSEAINSDEFADPCD